LIPELPKRTQLTPRPPYSSYGWRNVSNLFGSDLIMTNSSASINPAHEAATLGSTIITFEREEI
jgi:hypothetical protein